MKFAVVIMIVTLDPFAMVEGTAKPVMIALEREARGRIAARDFIQTILSTVLSGQSSKRVGDFEEETSLRVAWWCIVEVGRILILIASSTYIEWQYMAVLSLVTTSPPAG